MTGEGVVLAGRPGQPGTLAPGRADASPFWLLLLMDRL